MTARIKAAALALAASVVLLPIAATAECRTAAAGAHCIRVLPAVRPGLEVENVALTSASASTALVELGEVLPRGEYSIILNAEYYGLPPVADGWVYMRVGQDAYRVDWRSHEVLERVTDRAAGNF